jgi:hypothetical protein
MMIFEVLTATGVKMVIFWDVVAGATLLLL